MFSGAVSGQAGLLTLADGVNILGGDEDGAVIVDINLAAGIGGNLPKLIVLIINALKRLTIQKESERQSADLARFYSFVKNADCHTSVHTGSQ